MRRRAFGAKAVHAAAGAFLSGLVSVTTADTVAEAEAAGWQSISAERLLAPEPGDWLSYRRTYDVTGFSPLDEINRDTVRHLRLVWSYSMRDNFRWVPTPIVANGLMYVAEGSGRVVAFDAVSGEVVWTHVRTYPEDISASEAHPRHRGVSVYGDRIYWGTADSYLLALDARTGDVIWEVRTGDYQDGSGHAHPPLIAEGKVFLGHAGGDFLARGRFQAFDAEDGTLLWTTYTVPREGEPGYETWTENEEFPTLGGAPWNTISFDPDLRLVYFSTGQPTPWTTASRGPGDSLYTNSVIAVDPDTGEMRWHFQLNPADDWDRAAYENMLVDLEIDGVMRKALIQTGKIGWGVVLDRETGEFLHAFRTAYDNVVTGWTTEGRPIYDPRAIPAPEDVDSGKVFEICPHIHGARNLQAPSYSPLTGLYYLGVNNSCMNAVAVTPTFIALRGFTGVTFTPSLAPGYDYVGEFVAFDPVTGKRAWVYRPESGAPMTASALATAGGIVFGGTADRYLFALHSETGELLWRTRLNGDISGAPVTFEVDGKQYLAVGAGGRIAQTPTLGRLVDIDVPQGTGVLWVFALPDDLALPSGAETVTRLPATPGGAASAPGGAASAAQSAASAARIGAGAGPDLPTRSLGEGLFTAQQAALGEQWFSQACATCHEATDHIGVNFLGKWSGSTLDDLYQEIAVTMPPENPGGMTPEAYASIVAFFLSRTGYPAGDEALPPDRRVLRSVPITAEVLGLSGR